MAFRGAPSWCRCHRCRQRHIVCRKQGLCQLCAVVRVDLGRPTSPAQEWKATHGCAHPVEKQGGEDTLIRNRRSRDIC